MRRAYTCAESAKLPSLSEVGRFRPTNLTLGQRFKKKKKGGKRKKERKREGKKEGREGGKRQEYEPPATAAIPQALAQDSDLRKPWPRQLIVPIGEDPAAHGHWCAFTDLYHTIPSLHARS